MVAYICKIGGLIVIPCIKKISDEIGIIINRLQQPLFAHLGRAYAVATDEVFIGQSTKLVKNAVFF